MIQSMEISAADQGYDFQVKLGLSGDGSGYNRRYAGHVEIGIDSISDPIMGFKPMTVESTHPIVPLKYRRLIKSMGRNISTAGQKDAVWIYNEEL